MIRRLIPVALVSASTFAVALPEAEGDFSWGGRTAHPAVVNPVMGNEDGSVLSLRGEWEFSTQGRTLGRNGIWQPFYKAKTWPEARTIQVPGCWEAQGVGEPGNGECWDAVWDHNAKPIRHKHMGNGWYRKTVTIPAAWKGKRVWLKVGGVKSVGWFWVNDRQVALVDNYCGTYKYEVTDLVTPGSNATVVALVKNDVPSRKGLFSAMHRWGGIYRDVEFEATPPSFIDDVWVRGLFDEKAAEVHVTVGGSRSCATAKTGGSQLVATANPAGAINCAPPVVRVTIDGRAVEQTIKPSNHQTVKLPLADFRPWSPEHPNLYTARVDLVENGQVIQTRHERFGVRKFKVRGKEFYLNGKPFYVRGFGDDHVYPMTGLTPPDRDLHRAHLAKARAAGFNFVRLHTHTELPEYYEAADELGIMIEPELPYYSDSPTEGFAFDPKRDVTELWRNFRRHPSFAVYSMGNEGSFGPTLDARLHAYVKAMDPDRLKINQDCQSEKINPPEAADYLGGPIKPWPRGSFNPERPFVTHEYLNLCIKCDSRDEARYTGVWMPPATRKGRADWLAKFGLDHTWGDRLQDAQNALQRHYQQQGVEAARSDPYCDGHIFWTIVDVVVGQGNPCFYTAQGLFNPFWEPKRGGFSPEEFARFNSPSCILLDVPDTKRVFASGDTLAADFLFANYDEPLKGASLTWRLDLGGSRSCATATPGGSRSCATADAQERVPPVGGSLPIGEIPLGPARKVATANITFPDVAKPTKATLTATVGGGTPTLPECRGCASVSNSWDFWVFPRRAKHDGSAIAVAPQFRAALEKRYDGLLPASEAARAKVVVAAYGTPLAAEALARGQRVVTLAGTNGKPNVSLGWWWMGRQVGTALANHPALTSLPHEGVLSPLLFRLVLDSGKPMPYAGLAQDDMLIVGEGGSLCYLYLAQGNVGPGKALMAFGLNLLADTPEAAAFLDGLVDYAASDRFAPKSRVEMSALPSLNGWGKTVRAGDSTDNPGDVMEGYSRMAISRARAGQTDLVWETLPVPPDVRTRPTYEFTFAGGMGYPQQPQAAFALSLNGKKIIDIPQIVWKDHEWKGKDCVLRYAREKSTEELGRFTLTVPSSLLAPGKPATLCVTAEDKGSRRWFAVMEP